MPNDGYDHEFILHEAIKVKDSIKETFKISGAVYIDDPKHMDLMKKVNNATLYTNPLHDLWPQLKKQRAEIISMIKRKFNGDDNVCGTITSGGTTSIMAAMYAHREYYNYAHPNIIMSEDAHPAYAKACHYFGIIPKIVKVNMITRMIKLNSIRKRIDCNTICIITSAPSYPFGVVDNIPKIAQLALYYNCGCHVDACLGGGLLPWSQEIVKIPDYDFRVPGVTSISIDTHKYFYAPKGSSIILFKNKELRNCLTFVKMDWPGGFYVTPSFVGSSSGTNIAETWASILYMGNNGFKEMTHKILNLQRELLKEIKLIPEILVLGNPQLSVIGMVSKEVNMHAVQDIMAKKGWYFNSLQNPIGIHFCITATQTNVPNFVMVFINDMKEAIAIEKENKTSSNTKKLYCSTATIPTIMFDTLTKEIGEYHQFCDEQYVDSDELI
jgi:glutamate/tyrosine decarboxylase-like PLP-dependent enzyme